jgi:hypothetical protein
MIQLQTLEDYIAMAYPHDSVLRDRLTELKRAIASPTEPDSSIDTAFRNWQRAADIWHANRSNPAQEAHAYREMVRAHEEYMNLKKQTHAS